MKRLYRSRTDRWLAGVAGGLGEYFDVDPTLIRLVWVVLLIPGGLPGLLPYLICWIVIPREPETTVQVPTSMADSAARLDTPSRPVAPSTPIAAADEELR
jgi:phage shock protein C